MSSRFTTLKNTLGRFFTRRSKPRGSALPIVLPDEWAGAGCIFTNGRVLLAGYQPGKKQPAISGIGGTRDDADRDVFDTAMRETLEELFGDIAIDTKLVDYIRRKLPPVKKLESEISGWGTYISIVYTFDDLETLMRIVAKKKLKSDMYNGYPYTLSELILDRKLTEKAEISHICILPVVKHDDPETFVSADSMDDIRELLKKN